MTKVIGFDNLVDLQCKCKACAAIVQYSKQEESLIGINSVIDCPNCGTPIIISKGVLVARKPMSITEC